MKFSINKAVKVIGKEKKSQENKSVYKENEIKFIKKRLYKIGVGRFNICSDSNSNLSKYTVELLDRKGEILGYAKVAKKGEQEEILQNEYNILKILSYYDFKKVIVPEIQEEYSNEEVFTQNRLRKVDEKIDKFQEKLVLALEELSKVNYREGKVYDLLSYKNIRYLTISLLPKSVEIEIRKINKLGISMSLQHMNLKQSDIKGYRKKIYISNWEYGESTVSFFDIMEYYFRLYIEKDKLFGDKLIKKIKKNNDIINMFIKYSGELNLDQGIFLFLLELVNRNYFINGKNNSLLERENVLSEAIRLLKKGNING